MLEVKISPDLPLHQSLGELQDAANRIFEAISRRVSSQSQQLKSLLERTLRAQAKVDEISGSKRATIVYSSAKYPRVDPAVADFVPLLKDAAQYDSVKLDINGQWQGEDEGTLELFQFFSETSHEYWLKDRKRRDGVGKVPPEIKSVTDLLLFNSTELPYYKYRVVDNLAGVEQLNAGDELDFRPAALPAAPQSIVAGDVVPGPGGDEFGFRPVLREIPSFSLPPVLPDLPMVAEINWSGISGGKDKLQSIAPSAVHGGPYSPRCTYSMSPRFESASASTRIDPASIAARLDSASEVGSVLSERKVKTSKALPPLILTTTPVERSAQPRASRSGSVISSSGSNNSALNMPSASVITESIVVDSQKTQIPQVTPPAPPPPTIPIPPFQSDRGSQSGRKLSSQPSIAAIDSQRAALMASIRNSGLDLLRKTGRSENSRAAPATSGGAAISRTDVEVPEKIMSPEVKQPIQPAHVMAEMAKSLTLRRLSMRGAAHSQVPVKNNTRDDSRGGQQTIESGSSSSLTLPNLGETITGKDEDEDDDDDWE